jgi:hypothetical protein
MKENGYLQSPFPSTTGKDHSVFPGLEAGMNFITFFEIVVA